MNKQSLFTLDQDRLILNVKVIPGAGMNQIAGVKNQELVTRIKAIPEKGRANKELVKFLADKLHIPKSDIEISRGERSRHKIIMLPKEAAPSIERLIIEETHAG